MVFGKKKQKAEKKGKGMKKGDKWVCSQCGLVVTVDETCGCVETCDIMCCGKAMKQK
jgi:rubrerythrin